MSELTYAAMTRILDDVYDVLIDLDVIAVHLPRCETYDRFAQLLTLGRTHLGEPTLSESATLLTARWGDGHLRVQLDIDLRIVKEQIERTVPSVTDFIKEHLS